MTSDGNDVGEDGELEKQIDDDAREPQLDSDRLRELGKKNLDRSPRDVWDRMTRFPEAAIHAICPPVVSEFVVALLEGIDVGSVLDPCVGWGTLLKPVVEAVQADNFVGVGESRVAALEFPARGTGEYREGGCDGGALHADEEFDLIVSAPPFGVWTGWPRSVEVGDSTKVVAQLLSTTANHLTEAGLAVFVVTPNFFYAGHRPLSLAVSDHQLHVHAAFRLPRGTFRPLSEIESYVVLLRRGEAPPVVFVAEASLDGPALANYRSERDSGAPELGALLELETFRGLQPLISARALDKLGRRTGFTPRYLRDLWLSVERCPEDRRELVIGTNSLFIRTTDPTAVTDPAALPNGRLRDWYQIDLDPNKADARVLAGYFNGPLGGHALVSHTTGATVPRISKAAIGDLRVFVPEVDDQLAVVDLDARLRTLEEEVETLRAKLWRNLDRASEVDKEFSGLNRKDTFTSWLDTLPFPLASILWTYHTSKTEPYKAYQLLDHFFEGLTQFLAVLLLSAARRDEGFFDKEWKPIREMLDGRGLALERSTLGTWVIVYERLAKLIRGEVNAESKDHWMQMFACEDLGLLQAIVSGKMVQLVKRANEFRNDWRGHGGVVGVAESCQRSQRYYDMLLDFRSLVTDRWASYPLLLPDVARWNDEYHVTDAAIIMGSRTPFDRTEISVKRAMTSGQLHMASRELATACKLLPLVRLGPAAADEFNACYFYNRVESEGQRFVSYHFVEKSEILESSASLIALLSELSA